jgi:DNA/RNA endonuclease YhcR with UshA esterase domain
MRIEFFKTNLFTVASLLTSLAGLITVYFASVYSTPHEVELEDVTYAEIGNTVTVKGLVSHVNFHENGHVFITLKNGRADLQVPLFKPLANAVSKKVDLTKISGKTVSVTGTVGEFRGQMQIIPRKSDDFKLLG